LFNYLCKKNNCMKYFVVTILLVYSASAQAAEGIVQTDVHTNRIAVMSFQSLAAEENGGNTVFCPICGIGSSSGKILEGAEKTVEEIFVDRLKKVKGLELIPSEKVQGVYKRISSEKLKGPYIDNLKKAGKELGADYIATGFVYRYVERVGYKYSSERPASVIFEIHLVKTADGSVIWRGYFDKTQKSLLEDIFQIASFFKGGAKWVTVRQLTEQGMDEVLKTFPNL
jgi:TolB-like protein